MDVDARFLPEGSRMDKLSATTRAASSNYLLFAGDCWDLYVE
jgi:hypothetical protein